MTTKHATLGLLALLAPLVSHGSLIAVNAGSDSSFPENSVVDAVVEAFDPGGSFYKFGGLDWSSNVGRIVGVDVDLVKLADLADEAVSIADNHVLAHASQLTIADDVQTSVETRFLEESASNSVREPGSLSLLIAGLGLLVLGELTAGSHGAMPKHR